MGNCTSRDSSSRRRRRRRRRRSSATDGSPADDYDAYERRWSDRGPDEHVHGESGGSGGGRRRVLQSMARVGSRVFRQSTVEEDLRASGLAEAAAAAAGVDDDEGGGPEGWEGHGRHGANGGAKKRAWKEHKASTYEHVHQTVEAGIDACHELSDRGCGAGRGAAGRVGLANLGNTCFLNSSLQCLSNTIPLTDYFLGYDFRGEINRDNFLGTGGRLVGSYAELTKHLWLGAEGTYRPEGFKRDLERFAPQFEGCEQHDAQE